MSNFLPPGSHLIPLDQAKAMAIRYQENKDKILAPEYLGQNILCTCETFRKEEFLQYLSREDVTAFRIYYGMSENLQVHAILLGVDEDGNDILPKTPAPGEPNDGDGGEIFEDGLRCPDSCPPVTGCLLNATM